MCWPGAGVAATLCGSRLGHRSCVRPAMRHFALHVTGSVGREAQHCAQLRRRVHVPAACLLAQLPPPARNRCNGGGAGSACRSPAAGRRRRPAVASTAAAAGGSAAIPPTLEDWIRSSGGVVEGVQLATTLYPSGKVYTARPACVFVQCTRSGWRTCVHGHACGGRICMCAMHNAQGPHA